MNKFILGVRPSYFPFKVFCRSNISIGKFLFFLIPFLEVLKGKAVVGDDLAATLQTAIESCVSNTTLGAGTAESGKAVTTVTDELESAGILPQVSDKLPDEAFDYFSGL